MRDNLGHRPTHSRHRGRAAAWAALLLLSCLAAAPAAAPAPRPAEPKYLEGLKESAALMLVPDGRTLAAVAKGNYRGTELLLWDLAAGKVGRTVPLKFEAPHAGAATLSPDGKLLALPADGGVKLIDVAAGTVVREVKVGSPTALAFSRDGRLLAAGKGTPEVYDVATGKLLATGQAGNQPRTGTVAGLAFSPDGKRVAFTWGYDATEFGWAALVCDAATGKLIHTLKTPLKIGPTRGVAFAPDGAAVVVAGEGGLAVFDATTGKPRGGAEYSAHWYAVAFTAGGESVVSCGQVYDAAARRRQQVLGVFDARTGAARGLFADTTPTAAPAPADAVLVTPDGRQAITSGGSATGYATVKVWDLSPAAAAAPRPAPARR